MTAPAGTLGRAPAGGALHVLHDGAGDAALDMAVSHALLRRVAAGEHPPALRVLVPRPTMAFGRLDALRGGFGAAVAAAGAHGLEPVLRVAGGHAAPYHEGCLVVEEAVAGTAGLEGMQERFADRAALLAGALRSLGVDARRGEVAREYCPGASTVNARGRVKLAGTAQRVLRDGWLLAIVLVVERAAPLRAALVDVYAALGLDLDAATVGAVEDEVPGLSVAVVRERVLKAYAARHPLVPAPLDPGLVEAAHGLRARHTLR